MAKGLQHGVTIVGGGVVGASIAHFLADAHGIKATVIERDPSYRRASSALSASSLRQQFSTTVNIALSRESLALMRDWREELGWVEAGYLYLASDVGEPGLRRVQAVQAQAGADVRLLEPTELRRRWPWLCTDGIALGAWGASGEGWFDGPALHQRLRRLALAGGARFVTGEATGFDTRGGRVEAVLLADGRRLPCGLCVLAAGAWTAALAGRLGLDVPVRARKRDVFVLDSPARLPGCPLLIDPAGVWMRPEGTGFLAGAPPRGADPDEPPLEAVDHGLFEASIWPSLAARIPAFEALRVRSAWAGYYEMNTFDHNALVGLVPGWDNLHLACGFSGHGMQHALAVGRSLASWLARDDWAGVDLTPLSPARLALGRPLVEANVI